MSVRRASVHEAEQLWEIRNLAIRHGCKNTYAESILTAWTPDLMPAGFPNAITRNPFFVADSPEGFPAATGFLDVENASVEAIFTRPGFEGKGLATKILNAIKAEAKSLGFSELTLSSTPNAFEFYKRNGFCLVKESVYRSELANASLLCMDMRCEL